jgi:uncharacterized protein RhaS with RHS repeats
MSAVAAPQRRSLVGRYYDPQTGQFISVDPLVDQTEQAYEYVGGDPVDLIDPTGLEFCIGDWCPHDSLEFAKGEVIGAAKFAVATGKAVVHPVAFAQGLASTCSSAYASEGGGFDGSLNCIDSLNPFSGFVSAFHARCPEQAGEDVGGSLAATFATLAGGAEAGSTGGSAVTIGAKVARQMEARGWTRDAIDQAINEGQQVRAVNKANGNPATRYVNPMTGQSVVVDDVTGEVIHVGGPGFRYGTESGDVQ